MTAGSKYSGDVWVAIVNDIGSLLRERTYPALGLGRALGIIPASDGGCIVAGTTDSHPLWMMRLDRGGNVIWSRTFEEGPEFAEVTLYRVYSVREKPDGSVDLLYRVGRTLEGEAVGRSVTVDRSLGRDGSDMSVTEFYMSCPVARTSDEGYVCACLESPQSDGYTFGNYLGSPIHIVKFDDRGEIARDQTGTRAEVNIVADIVQTSDGGFAVLGMYTKTWVRKNSEIYRFFTSPYRPALIRGAYPVKSSCAGRTSFTDTLSGRMDAPLLSYREGSSFNGTT